jgi:Lipopolysaccharide kinase (Kdo/WaaP) family
MINLARRIQLFSGRKFLVEADYERQLRELGIHADMDWVNYPGGELVSDSPTTRCRRITSADGSAFYFKRYICPFQRGIQFWMRPGKGAVEVWAYRQLQALGIPTLDIVAFGEERVLGVLQSNFLISRAVPNSQDLDHFALNSWYQMPEPMRRQAYNEVSSHLIMQTRRAHKARFFHHDLKWRNILVRKQDNHYSTVWIDAPRASKMRLRKARGAIVDLSGLARIAVSLLSVYDRMRFIWKYLGRGRRPGDSKRLYRKVAANLSRRPPDPIQMPAREPD